MKKTKAKLPPLPWPKLSEELPVTAPGFCRRCGGRAMKPEINDGHQELVSALERWEEHDELDRPLRIVVELCEICAAAIIEAHPRLYRRLAPNTPMPGTMAICVGCTHRDETSNCTSPLLNRNGGPGLNVEAPQPSRMHLNYGGGRGEFVFSWPGPATACAGWTAPEGA